MGAPSFAFLAKGGWQTDRTIGFVFHAVPRPKRNLPRLIFKHRSELARGYSIRLQSQQHVIRITFTFEQSA